MILLRPNAAPPNLSIGVLHIYMVATLQKYSYHTTAVAGVYILYLLWYAYYPSSVQSFLPSRREVRNKCSSVARYNITIIIETTETAIPTSAFVPASAPSRKAHTTILRIPTYILYYLLCAIFTFLLLFWRILFLNIIYNIYFNYI